MEFEKDKWYKLKTCYDWYAKFKNFSDDTWYGSELIKMPDERYESNDCQWGYFKRNDYTAELVTNILEIAHLLPKGHPDLQNQEVFFCIY